MRSRLAWRLMNAKKYLAMIGARGGRKRAEHPNRSALAKRAANARWNNAKRISIEHATHLASYPNKSPSEKQPI